jgi:hypothetical protein
VSHSTRIRLPLKADPSQMNLNSYLLTLTQKHLKIQNVGSVWLSIESVFQETGSECRARGFVSLHKLAKEQKIRRTDPCPT